MKEPSRNESSVEELLRFLAVINYLSPYINNLADKCSNLWNLLKKDCEWKWDVCHPEKFNLKQIITNCPILGYYDTNQTIVVSYDPSKDALEASISQKNKPIAFASTKLNKSQKSYAKIEKEMLGITYACTKFSHYIYGRIIIIKTEN